MKENMKKQYLTRKTNPTLWNEMTRKGAPKPSGSSVTWNDWAANNPTPQAMALANATLSLADSTGLLNPRGILGSAARPVDCE